MNWQEEFDKEFPEGSIIFDKPASTEWYTDTPKDIQLVKSFISSKFAELIDEIPDYAASDWMTFESTKQQLRDKWL